MNEQLVEIPDRYLKELPPRKLDVMTQAILMVGDAASQVGWLLVAMGAVFFWTIAVHSEARLLLEERNVKWESKPGFIISADSTYALEGKERIWKYRHSFGLDGRRYKGESYSVGKKFDALQTAYVRFDPQNPSKNYLVGLRRNEFSSKADWFLLVPVFGLLLLVLPIRYNLRVLRLLKIGDFTRGKLVNKYATGETLRKGGSMMPEFRYSFAFELDGQPYLAHCRTAETDKVEDEETEIILYDRFNPTSSLVYDAVPNIPEINEAGQLEPLRGLTGWVLFLPVFTVVLNLVYFFST